MNALTKLIEKGTFGEIYTQLRLLQFGIQAAPPLKDSGNDLIAIKKDVFKAIQVKTRTGDRISISDLPEFYHILAIVHIDHQAENLEFGFDKVKLYLLNKEDVNSSYYSLDSLEKYKISSTLINELFL